ncbi:MAG: hypothetical protein JO302_07425 [Candidatus Eremiobacteraeota bacterium]|nr:hypothetical protein [Candidatus Eremiobacteraeota bacterium]
MDAAEGIPFVMRRAALCYALLLAACSGSQQYAPFSYDPPAAPARPLPGAAVFSQLFSFDGKNGKIPAATLVQAGAALAGTTYGGGTAKSGTAYTITTSGTHTVLHDFKGGKDGALPIAGLLDVKGTLYGTTVNGGVPGEEGVVFAISPSGAETVLHRFAGGNDGANPYAPPTMVAGTLYGTTAGGGSHSGGTIFSISPSGAEQVVYDFGRTGADGTTPAARLANVGGTLYGTTSYGGGGKCTSAGCGTVFKFTTSGTETIVHTFTGGHDGAIPQTPVIDLGGTLYGSTSAGGTHNAGTVFKITRDGTESVLYAFKGGSDGAIPQALALFHGMLYGTTSAGGSKNQGTIFALTTAGKKTIVHDFTGGTGGGIPRAGLRAFGAALYGTTAQGGAHGGGTVFSIAP